MTELNNLSQIAKISGHYFDYMAKNYPVMCSCDEFYFFPRAKNSAKFLNILDSLDKQKIKQDVSYIKNLKSSLEKIDNQDMDLEVQIDLILLGQSISTFLREFEQTKIWQTDPNLYLKVIMFGVNQILTRFSFVSSDIEDSLLARIASIPRILSEAKSNLNKIPSAYLEVAKEMADSSIDYFKNTTFISKNKCTLLKEINAARKEAIQALEDFKRFLIRKTGCEAIIKDRQLLMDILKDSFSYNRSPEELFDIACGEYRSSLNQLVQLAKRINPVNSWQGILSTYSPDIKNTRQLLGLYDDQIRKIENFFKEKDVITIPETQNILVELTPDFMKPIRASASYSSPITDDIGEPAYFYITADFTKTKKPDKKLLTGIHNEYIFVTSHETYPGHHLLDSIRRRLTNPIRQQIESPLFYEGWASYAERLIDQLGYIKDPLQRLVGFKRQAWRAIRAMLDVGMRINKFNYADAGRLLKDLGYSSNIVKSMLKHYILTPGYQLCYTIGKFEIDLLKNKFSAKLGLKKFHDSLLEAGQIPFYLIETRLEKKLCQKNS